MRSTIRRIIVVATFALTGACGTADPLRRH